MGGRRIGVALAALSVAATALVGVIALPAAANLASPRTEGFFDPEYRSGSGPVEPLTFSSVTANMYLDEVQFAMVAAGPIYRDLQFAAVAGQSLTVGTYENASSFRDATHPLLVGDTSWCGGFTTGRFIVDQIAYNADNVASASIRFESHCNGTDTGATFGAVTYNANADYRTTSQTNILTFPSTRIGLSSPPQTATITNNGPSNLTISNVGITGTDFYDFHVSSNGCSTSLSAGQSCTIGVTFAPSSIGERTAKLTFFDELAPYGGGGTGRDVELVAEGFNPPPWAALFGTVVADPAVVVSGTSVIALGVTPNGQMRRWTATNSIWGGGVNVPSVLDSVPSATDSTAGPYAFVLGSDDSVYYTAPSNPDLFLPLGGR